MHVVNFQINTTESAFDALNKVKGLEQNYSSGGGTTVIQKISNALSEQGNECIWLLFD